jgi:hypothetical protein
MEDGMVMGGSAAAGGAAGGAVVVIQLIQLAIAILIIVSFWKIFVKAGKPGWAAIVPIYNVIVMLEIAGKPLWWIVLYFIPVANIVVGILAMIGLVNRFGKGTGFALGLVFLSPIFAPILAFGSAECVGVGGEAVAPEPVAEVPAPAPEEAPQV